MNNGWLKLHRRLLKKTIWKNSSAEQKVILITLLLMANYEENNWEWQGKNFKCQPGQFITSLKSIRENTGLDISYQNIRTALEKFTRYEFLTYQSTKTGRLISITNWGFYQELDCDSNKDFNNQLTKPSQSPNKELTKLSQTDHKELTTIKKEKNIRIKEIEEDKKEKSENEIKKTPNEKPNTQGKNEKELNDLANNFEKFWQVYPKKSSRIEAKKNYSSLIKKGVSEEVILTATKNYARQVFRDKTESKYIIEAKNFVGRNERYKDYLLKEGEDELKPYTGDELPEPEPFF